MFIPANDQAELKQRVTDVAELRQMHNQFRKLTEVKVKMLENENVARKGELSALIDAYRNMGVDLEKTKTFLASTQIIVAELSQKIDSLALSLNDLASRKLDLAAKITAAQKRLDEAGKA